MTTSLKDVSSAQMINTLIEMNCFEKEYTIYGYVWRTDSGKKLYRLSEDELLIQHAFERQVIDGDCMTPIQQWQTQAALRDENKDDYLMYYKLQLVQQMQADFPDEYFKALATLQNVQADNSAESLLLEWQQEIDGYFDMDALQAFAGALDLAYSTKHLADWQYKHLNQWIQSVKKQIVGKNQRHDNFERTFYGVAYETESNDGWQYLSNANEKSLYNQVKELDFMGIKHTPVYQKTYWYHRSSDLASVRKQFNKDLRAVLDDCYLERIMKIFSLPGVILDTLWEDVLSQITGKCSKNAKDALLFWAGKWNISC